jgi:hypothetical protein
MATTWFRDREAGDEAERRLARALSRRGWRALQTVGNDGFDLVLLTTVEVKHDRHAHRTGKLAVEVESRGRPSGILTSTADFWAFVSGDMAVLVPRAVLRRRTLLGAWQERVCGDDNQTVIRLAPIEEIAALGGIQFVSLDDTLSKEHEHA